MDLSLLFLHRQGLAGRPRGMQARPTCRSQGSSRRSGRFPALPYPPLEQVGSVPSPNKSQILIPTRELRVLTPLEVASCLAQSFLVERR